jgi:glycosyltransferase involved in cell wall biosynthesis
MTLLVLSDFFSIDQSGGLGRVAWESAKALARAGHEIIAVEPRASASNHPERISGVEVYRSAAKPGLTLREFLRPRFDLIDKATSRFEPAGVIVHGPLSGSLAHRSRALRSLPRLMVFHSPWGDEYRIDVPGARGRLGASVRTHLERKNVSTTPAFVTLSSYMSCLLRERHSVESERIRIVPGGVDSDQFNPGDGRLAARERLGWPLRVPTLVTVRNLRARMGLSTLLEAVATLRTTIPALRWVLVGDGPQRQELQDRARDLGLADVVELAGFVGDSELPDYYRAADLSVVPTVALEGFGLVILEALACGTPAVSTPVGGIPEILEDLDRRLLCPDTTAAGMANTLSVVLKDDGLRADLAARCRPYVEARFSWPRFATGLIDAMPEEARNG